jgi:hypothetical protein
VEVFSSLAIVEASSSNLSIICIQKVKGENLAISPGVVETTDIILGSHFCFDSPPTLVWIQGDNWDNSGMCFILGNGSSI